MHFNFSNELFQKIRRMKRVPAIRMLRETFDTIGCVPDLRTIRDLVDKIQRGEVAFVHCAGWASWKSNTILVSLEK